jgi:hypothetical protein
MYNDLTGSGECMSCPEGYFCSDEGMTKPEICMLNSYCPEGSVEPTACPEGTESNLVGSTTEADCLEIIDPIIQNEEDETVVDLIEDLEEEESADVEIVEEPSVEEASQESEEADESQDEEEEDQSDKTEEASEEEESEESDDDVHN